VQVGGVSTPIGCQIHREAPRGMTESNVTLPHNEHGIIASTFLQSAAIPIGFCIRMLSLKHPRYRRHISTKKPLTRRSNTRIIDPVSDTDLGKINSHKRGGTGSAASCATVHSGEPDPVIAAQRVNAGCFYLRAE